MRDLFGNPIDWNALPAAEAADQLYTLADRAPCGSEERARIFALAGRYAARARAAAEKEAIAAARRAECAAEDLARIKRATWAVPA